MYKVINVESKKQLFIDYKYIEQMDGLKLNINQPGKDKIMFNNEPKFAENKVRVCSIIEDENKYIMYYDYLVEKADLRNEEKITHKQILTCIAESSDGVEWFKKTAGAISYNGSSDNNIVMAGAMGNFFIDTNSTLNKKYWWFGSISENDIWDESQGTYYISGPNHEGALYFCYSENGLKWNRVKEPAIPFWCDTWNQCFFDDRINKYVIYTRGWEPEKTHSYPWKRVVCRTETKDIRDLPLHFTPNESRKRKEHGLYGRIHGEIPVVLEADEPGVKDLYTPCVIKYPYAQDVYLSFTSCYRRFDGQDTFGRDNRGKFGNDGLLEVQLAVSRDGIKWHRFNRPYMPLGMLGEKDSCGLYMSSAIILKGNQIWQYYTGTSNTHGDLKNYKTTIKRAVQRLDGFISLDTEGKDGQFVTPLIKFTGNRLILNIDCGATGEAWVQVLDDNGLLIPGYTFKDAVSVDRNGVEQEVWWKNGPDISVLEGRSVRLNIKMRFAKLYSFQFKYIPKK